MNHLDLVLVLADAYVRLDERVAHVLIALFIDGLDTAGWGPTC